MKRALLLSVALGCTDGLVPGSVVAKTRILAVRADPPEGSSNATITLDALVATVDEHEPSYEWLRCEARVSGQASPCDQADLLNDVSALRATEGVSVISTSSVASLRLNGPEDAAVPVILSIDGGKNGTLALKEVRIAAEPVNHNPQVDFVVVAGFRLDDEDQTLVASPAQEVPFSAIVTPDSVEAFRRRLPDDSLVDAVESLQYAWFTTLGRFGTVYEAPSTQPIRDLFVDSGVKPPKDASIEEGGGESSHDEFGRKVTLRLPETLEGPSARSEIWVVVRDGRGGITWAHRSMLVRAR